MTEEEQNQWAREQNTQGIQDRSADWIFAVGGFVKASIGSVPQLLRMTSSRSTAILKRPYVRISTRRTVENNALKIGDKFVDANTGKIIEGTYHLGHRYGHEFYKYRAWGQSMGLTQGQFNNFMNNPALYQIEDAFLNMSHRYEAPRDIFYLYK